MKIRWLSFFVILQVTFSSNIFAGNYIIADRVSDSVRAVKILADAIVRVEATLGRIHDDSLAIYIVDTKARFDSLAGRGIPDWGAGVALPVRRRIVIKSERLLTGPKGMRELLIHEYSHIAMARFVRYHHVPRWLDEGMAVYHSAEWGWQDNLAVSWAAVLGYLMPLPKIEKLNRFTGDQAQLSYSESYLAFSYFVENYGLSSLHIVLDNYRRGKSDDVAFKNAIGLDYAGFNDEFMLYLKGRYNVLTLIFDSSMLWVVLAFIFVLGLILNRVRRKKRYAELDEYDKLHSSDFDYGEVEEPDEDKPWD